MENPIRPLFLTALMLAAVSPAVAQTEAWLKVEEGDVLVLAPGDATWMPSEARQRVPLQAFLLTKAGADAHLFVATEVYELPSDAYFFVDDVIPKERMEIVDALSRIEAAQLPRPKQEQPARVLGLTYGSPASIEAADLDVPYAAERLRAIDFYYQQQRYDAALLMLKRAMQKFPELYADEGHVDLLLALYAHFQLYGFLLDECDRLRAVPQDEPVSELVHRWSDVARKGISEQRE